MLSATALTLAWQEGRPELALTDTIHPELLPQRQRRSQTHTHSFHNITLPSPALLSFLSFHLWQCLSFWAILPAEVGSTLPSVCLMTHRGGDRHSQMDKPFLPA